MFINIHWNQYWQSSRISVSIMKVVIRIVFQRDCEVQEKFYSLDSVASQTVVLQSCR